MSIEKKYPCSVNRSEQVPNHYSGIMFNGDQDVYRKAIVNALKKAGVEEALITAVKTAEGDLAISKILIEADQFDVLVNVFDGTDARTAVFYYVKSLRDNVVDEFKADLVNIKSDFSKIVKNLDKNPDIDAALTGIDRCINECYATAFKKFDAIDEDIAKSVFQKYHEACAKKLRKPNEEM